MASTHDLVRRAHDASDFIHGDLRKGVLYGSGDLAARKLRLDFIRLGLIEAPVSTQAKAA